MSKTWKSYIFTHVVLPIDVTFAHAFVVNLLIFAVNSDYITETTSLASSPLEAKYSVRNFHSKTKLNQI